MGRYQFCLSRVSILVAPHPKCSLSDFSQEAGSLSDLAAEPGEVKKCEVIIFNSHKMKEACNLPATSYREPPPPPPLLSRCPRRRRRSRRQRNRQADEPAAAAEAPAEPAAVEEGRRPIRRQPQKSRPRPPSRRATTEPVVAAGEPAKLTVAEGNGLAGGCRGRAGRARRRGGAG